MATHIHVHLGRTRDADAIRVKIVSVPLEGFQPKQWSKSLNNWVNFPGNKVFKTQADARMYAKEEWSPTPVVFE